MTTVACVFVQGHVPFTVDYVTKLAAMVTRWMDRPYRFVVFTDRPWLIPDALDRVVVQKPQGCYAWWVKLQLFNPAHALEGRVLYLDLDTLIVNHLQPILDFPAPFALVPHAGRFEGKDGRAVVKRFNSSVMVWDAGVVSSLYHAWTPDVADRLWGDQDWIGQRCPQARTMPAEWFPRLSSINGGPIPEQARVILAKSPKNAHAARRWPWVRRVWRAA